MAFRIILVLFVCGTILGLCRAKISQDLGGEWIVTGTPQDGEPIRAKATVPGGIYSDLMDNDIIGDIFYGSGDEDYQWVGLTDWTYSTKFNVNESILENDHVNLIFEGLDTFAAVILNGKTVGQSENMFRRYIFDVHDAIKAGENSLHVVFTSAVNKAAELAELQNLNYVVPPNCPAKEYNGQCHANQVRKMQSSFSWDWGPSFPSMGIWKDVYLESYSTSVIRYLVSYSIATSEDVWTQSVCTWFSDEALKDTPGTLYISIDLGKGNVIKKEYVLDQKKDDFGEIVEHKLIDIPTDQFEKWYPNGYGEPKLYDLTVTYKAGDEVDERKIKIGFRVVEIVQEELGDGLSFYFKVNGVPIYAKGANQIPINILPEKGQDRDATRRLLESAKEANMNMLRVWGGGVYETDYFYDTADEFGIMIWQDFMFACAMYPARPEFLNNVLEEVRHQMKRLYRHPSIATYAGNNENEAALRQNWYGTAGDFETYKADFIKLYVDTIGHEVHRYVSFANYIVSSPTNGKESEDEGYVARNPSDERFGDVHFYTYAGNPLDTSKYPIARFASEYGFQSMPSISTWMTATKDVSDLDPAGEFVTHRQHHPNGYNENTAMIKTQFDLPIEKSANYAQTYIYYSQILQAMAVKAETEHYRSYTGRLNERSLGYNMGAMYWQLNDVWVAPTWSGMDYTGKWKMLHYFAKSFFAPILIGGHAAGQGNVEVFVVSHQPLEAEAVVQVFAWRQLGKPLAEYRYPIKLEADKAEIAATLNIAEILLKEECGATKEEALANCFFYLKVQNEEERVDMVPSNFYLPNPIKDSNLLESEVTIASVQETDEENVFEISVATTNVTLFVWLEIEDIEGMLSDNGFPLHQPTRTVTFRSREKISVEDLQKALTVTHLNDPVYKATS